MLLIFTGGTTGPSKACMISHNYMCALGGQLAKLTRLGPDDVMWTPLPAFHFNQLANMWGALMSGARFAVYPKFSVSNFWPEIERSGATVCNLLASMVTMLADAPDNPAMQRCHGQLRVVGGVPFPKATQEVWRRRFGVKDIFHSLFGLTECSPLTTYPLHLPMPAGACGKANENFEVMIVDADDNELPAGQPGEIVARPRRPHVMFEGYWGRPADSLKAWRNGWFHTGDIGRLDDEGFLFFVDRGKDYLRRRGENISSAEMEAVFRGHPDVLDVCVHAVHAELPEDEVKVTLVLKPGALLTEEALCRWSIDRVPYFAVPRFVEFRADLPRSPVGRVLKYQLRDDGITPATWDRDKAGLVIPKR
jgi:crotonobetaine/carnitine-CoA ligase